MITKTSKLLPEYSQPNLKSLIKIQIVLNHENYCKFHENLYISKTFYIKEEISVIFEHFNFFNKNEFKSTL